MSKGIVVVDIPKSCYYCSLYASGSDCFIVNGTNCPIKPMPEIDNKNYFPDEFLDGMAIGWNNCIDVILGGSDE